MGQRTPLYQKHCDAGAKMVDFGGWDMPVNYGSQIEEHHQVRRDAGVFDVSHMTVVDIAGPGAKDFLRYVLANDVARLQTPGKALYSCLLNPRGGVIDDLIAYWRGGDRYRLVVNAGTREKDLRWFQHQISGYDCVMKERADLAMLAIQGPNARQRVAPLLPPELTASALALDNFFAAEAGDWFIARTGYTGEDGFEVILPAGQVTNFWDRLLAAGCPPCGLGARDTLRLEAGMNLYGSDLDEETNPLDCGLGWTITRDPADRQFIGRQALATQPRLSKQVGLLLEGRGVLRGHQKIIIDGVGEGVITSGTFSPTLQRSIALARVPLATGEHCQVEIRDRLEPAKIVKPPFVRHGRILIEI